MHRKATQWLRWLPPLCLGLVSCSPSTQAVISTIGEAGQRTAEARQMGLGAATSAATHFAVESAAEAIQRARRDFDPSSLSAYTARCRGLLRRHEAGQALACLEEAASAGLEDSALGLIRGDALMVSGEFEAAREVFFGLRDRAPSTAGLQPRLVSSFRDDPRFLRPVETIEPGVQVTEIRALGGGSTVTLKFKLNGETIAAFKPAQTRRQSNYRAEVAAFRLCPIIRCDFEVPYSYEVRVEQRAFMRLYGIRSLEGQTGYAENFADLVWTHEDDGRYLHGVWKDWVPHFTQFPIEYEDIWASWVATDGDPTDLDQPLETALRPLRGRERGHFREIVEEAGTANTRDLARQISNLLVFDFLINNWDRFSGSYYGVNCQWASGQFVSIDNGAGFMTRDPVRPRQRLHQVGRFSRRLVEEVRQLDRESLLPLLFPDPTERERENFAVFWNRRQELLDYIDGLIAERGEDAVLFFD